MEPSKKEDQLPIQSNLITQILEETKISENLEQTDPVGFLEKELAIKIPQDTKDELRASVANIDSYKERVKKLLETMRTKYEGNYKMLKKIDHLIPLYDAHDFWDSQPVPKAYDTIDPALYDKPIDKIKTVSEVKSEPYSLP